MPPRPSRLKNFFRPKRIHHPAQKANIPAVQDYEHKEQSAFFSPLSRINHRAAQKCTYSHQNGYLDTVAKRLRAAREGAKKGTVDVFCRYPSQGKHGLYLEFKTAGRAVTPEQIDFMKEAIEDGYPAHLVYTWEEAMDTWGGELRTDFKTYRD